jgi:hypothetical protein
MAGRRGSASGAVVPMAWRNACGLSGMPSCLDSRRTAAAMPPSRSGAPCWSPPSSAGRRGTAARSGARDPQHRRLVHQPQAKATEHGTVMRRGRPARGGIAEPLNRARAVAVSGRMLPASPEIARPPGVSSCERGLRAALHHHLHCKSGRIMSGSYQHRLRRSSAAAAQGRVLWPKLSFGVLWQPWRCGSPG